MYEKFFDELKLEYVPSHTNFILVNVGNGIDVFRKALAEGVILRPMAAYNLPEFVRITIGNERENVRCIEVLRQILQQEYVFLQMPLDMVGKCARIADVTRESEFQ